ncbi:hypothetical protein RND71_013908 [Anisodus tanguticus]|uniref:Uncharacterized protein n=1 Tax=Anisodus tanguticus TaxID=243964 RepID=A0AAE1S8X3_9SOLA|nr:hypothetical protein RND71_013908 [Anisodus tanguticus]
MEKVSTPSTEVCYRRVSLIFFWGKRMKVNRETSLIKTKAGNNKKYLCAWGNDAASEVLTEARQLLMKANRETSLIKAKATNSKHLCAWSNDSASEVLTEADGSMKFASAAIDFFVHDCGLAFVTISFVVLRIWLSTLI